MEICLVIVLVVLSQKLHVSKVIPEMTVDAALKKCTA